MIWNAKHVIHNPAKTNNVKGKSMRKLSTVVTVGLIALSKVGMSVVDVDLNHPMAGKDLHFDVEIVDVREAGKEEIDHGHVHGDGGHQH